MLACMRLDQEGFKAFTLQVPCDPTLDQSTWQRREQRRPQQRHQPQRRRWRPQTSPPKVGSSNPEERFHILNQKKSWKIASNLARCVFCPYSARLRQRFEQSRFPFWRSCFSLEDFGPRVLWAWHLLFFSEPSPGEVSDPKLTTFPMHPGVKKYVTRSPLLLMKAKKA